MWGILEVKIEIVKRDQSFQARLNISSEMFFFKIRALRVVDINLVQLAKGSLLESLCVVRGFVRVPGVRKQ